MVAEIAAVVAAAVVMAAAAVSAAAAAEVISVHQVRRWCWWQIHLPAAKHCTSSVANSSQSGKSCVCGRSGFRLDLAFGVTAMRPRAASNTKSLVFNEIHQIGFIMLGQVLIQSL